MQSGQSQQVVTTLLRPEPAHSDIGALVAAAYPATALRTFFKDVREFCSASLRETIEAEMNRLHPPDRRGEISRLRKKPSFPKIASDGWTAYHRRRGHLVVRPRGDWQFDYRHAPQHLPDEWIAGHFTGVLDIHPRHLHITAAISHTARALTEAGGHAGAEARHRAAFNVMGPDGVPEGSPPHLDGPR
jgi:hypothetical protein